MQSMMIERSPLEAELFLACLGKAIRDHRWAMRISQQQMALSASIEPAELNEIESSVATDISVETLRRIADALNVPASYLMKQAEERMVFKSKR